jgi:DNA-binding NarL/FixJ family response regulator
MNLNYSELANPPQGTIAQMLDASRSSCPGMEPASQLRKARILVVEDHDFLREGIVRLLNMQSDLVCCGQAATLAAGVGGVIQQSPELLLLDIRLPDGDGLQLIDFVRPLFPNLMILVLSQSDEVSVARHALAMGANGYVIKQQASEVLSAIRELLRGKTYVSKELANRMTGLIPERHSLQGV